MLQLDIDEEIRLEELSQSHAPAIFRIVNNNREYLRKWLTFVDATCKLEDTEEFISLINATSHKSNGEIVVAILYRNSLVGLVGLKKVDWPNRIGELGYWLDEQYQGLGIITRSCRKLISHAYENIGFNRLEVKCGVGNIKSGRIPQRLGFAFEGIEREGELVNGTFIDIEVYSLLKKDWSTNYIFFKDLSHEAGLKGLNFKRTRTGVN